MKLKNHDKWKKLKIKAILILAAALTVFAVYKLKIEDIIIKTETIAKYESLTDENEDSSIDYNYKIPSNFLYDNIDTDSIPADISYTYTDDGIDPELLYKMIYAQIKDGGKECTITGVEKDDEDEIINFIKFFTREHPEIFWIHHVNEYMYNPNTNELKFNFNFFTDLSKAELEEQKNIYMDKIDSILKDADTSWCTYAKVMYVHDYLADNTYYDYDALKDKELLASVSNTYECLINGRAVCNSYSSSFKLLANMLGAEAGVVSGRSEREGHAWNYVKIANDYYWLDVTWDDRDKKEQNQGRVYVYFLLNDELFFKERTVGDDNLFVPVCDSMTENYYVKNNLYFEKYKFRKIKSAVKKHKNDHTVSFMFSSKKEYEKCCKNLIEKGEIRTIPFLAKKKISSSKKDEMYVLTLYF